MSSILFLLPAFVFVFLTIFTMRKKKKNLAVQLCAVSSLAVIFLCGDILNEFLVRQFLFTGNIKFSLSVFMVAVAGAFLLRINDLREVFKKIPFAFFITAALWCVIQFIEGEQFGAVTDSFFAWKYAQGSPAHTFQVARGLIDFTSGEALPVHPVQLYAAALFALCAIVTLWLRRMRFRPVALMLISFSLVFGVQLFLSFFIHGRKDSLTELDPAQLLLLLYWCNAAVVITVFGAPSPGSRMNINNKIVVYLFAVLSCSTMFYAPVYYLEIIVLFQLAVIGVSLHNRSSCKTEPKKSVLILSGKESESEINIPLQS